MNNIPTKIQFKDLLTCLNSQFIPTMEYNYQSTKRRVRTSATMLFFSITFIGLLIAVVEIILYDNIRSYNSIVTGAITAGVALILAIIIAVIYYRRKLQKRKTAYFGKMLLDVYSYLPRWAAQEYGMHQSIAILVSYALYRQCALDLNTVDKTVWSENLKKFREALNGCMKSMKEKIAVYKDGAWGMEDRFTYFFAPHYVIKDADNRWTISAIEVYHSPDEGWKLFVHVTFNDNDETTLTIDLSTDLDDKKWGKTLITSLTIPAYMWGVFLFSKNGAFVLFDDCNRLGKWI